MGLDQNKPQETKKTDEQIREDMRRKWDNFGSTQSSKIKEEKKEINQNINNNTDSNSINDEKKEEEKYEEEKEEKEEKYEEEKEEKEEKKPVFLSLKPRPKEEKEEKNEETIQNNEESNNIISDNINKNKEENITSNENLENNNNKENEKEEPEQTNNIDENTDNQKEQKNNIKETPNGNINNSQEEPTPKPVKKDIDLENVTIEKVFHISLSEDNPKKYLYLELYFAKILSTGQNPSFKLENLDEIILTVINEPSIKKDLLNYLLTCFHRAYEIIEVRFKDTLGPEFAQVHLGIATYFGQIVSSPESFELNVTKKQISDIIKNYYLKTPEEEFLFLFKDITINCGDDLDSLSLVLHYLFEIMHMENVDKQTFFKGVAIKKNLNLLLKILQDYPKVREVFLNDVLYNPQNINGRLIQALSFYGPYLSNSPLNTPQDQHRNAFKQFTNDSELKSYINKLNNIIETLSEILKILEEFDDDKSLNYFYNVINLNVDWQKTIKNFMMLSSIGFLLNMLFLCLNLFFAECHKHNNENNVDKSKEYKINGIKYINTKFCLNDKKIHFSKFNLIYSLVCKEYIDANKSKSESTKFNLITKLFFICHSLMNYIIPALMKLYMEQGKAASQAFSTLGFNNPQTKEHIIKLKLYDIYVKNEKFIKFLLEFNEITTFFLITLNNSKYAHNDEYIKEEKKEENNIINEGEDEYTLFKKDYFNYIDVKSNVVISSLPEFLILNIVNSCIFFRQAYPDLYFKDFDLLKNLVNFGLIYSSHINIIHNQHLRSQIFDILLYSFHLEEQEKNDNRLLMIHQKLLKDDFIKENLILSIMRVFIDAERLGTSNQFYERFNVRNKVLQLVNEVFKKHQEILIDNIINYANHHSDDATQMLTLLMGDVTYLIDEVIQRLIDIRNYQELKDNKELWNSKTQEQKTEEDNKFAENDRLLKAECRLLNHSLGFMTIICSCLQKYFIKEEKAERLADLMNYCLDEFTAKSSQLKIKNKNDYEFNPSYIMESIIKIFSYFVDYEEFLEFVVSDARAYKYDNFTKAIKLKNENKVKVDMEISENFDNIVYNKLKKAEESVEQKKINYDDAPEEFLDPLTYGLMENPVILPSSHINIDRRTIEDYLLTNPSDPFNRNPLTKEELIPNDDLKKKIDEYKANKLKEKQKNLNKKNDDIKINTNENNTEKNKEEKKIEETKEEKNIEEKKEENKIEENKNEKTKEENKEENNTEEKKEENKIEENKNESNTEENNEDIKKEEIKDENNNEENKEK